MARGRGGFDRLVRLEREGAPVDTGYTTAPGAWYTLTSAYAMQIVGRGSERMQLAAMSADVPVTFRVLWTPTLADLNPKDRLCHGTKVYDIKAVAELGRNDKLDIHCVARADG